MSFPPAEDEAVIPVDDLPGEIIPSFDHRVFEFAVVCVVFFAGHELERFLRVRPRGSAVYADPGVNGKARGSVAVEKLHVRGPF